MSTQDTFSVQGSRVTGTSTPSSAKEKSLREYFASTESPFAFNSDYAAYLRIQEEKDDALLRWYPMRIHYGRKKRIGQVNSELQTNGFRTFIHNQTVQASSEWKEEKADSLSYSIVFVYAMKIQLKLLKRFNKSCLPMQFMVVSPHQDNQQRHILWVPDDQMENFIKAATCEDPMEQRIQLTYTDFIDKIDKKVEILHGPFKGIKGEVKRIGRHRIVVALLRDEKVAVGITHVPPSSLRLLDE